MCYLLVSVDKFQLEQRQLYVVCLDVVAAFLLGYRVFANGFDVLGSAPVLVYGFSA